MKLIAENTRKDAREARGATANRRPGVTARAGSIPAPSAIDENRTSGKQGGDRSVGWNSHEASDAADPKPDQVSVACNESGPLCGSGDAIGPQTKHRSPSREAPAVIGVLVRFSLIVLLLLPSPVLASDTGWASIWGGPGTATNDCRFPWKDCTPRKVTSLDTGRSIVTVPSQFCLCRVDGVAHPDRLIDLGPAEWAALGLRGPGLWRVRVELLPKQAVLPNTATR